MNPITFLKWVHPKGPWALTAIGVNERSAETREFTPSTAVHAEEWLGRHNGQRNLYYSPNKPRDGLGTKASRNDIEEIHFLHVDVDARAGEPLGDELERIRTLVTSNGELPRPTLIVASGGGYHVLWRLRTPVPATNTNIERVEQCNRSLISIFGGDRSAFDVSRILRLPGTWNLPDTKKQQRGRVPREAEVCSQVDWLYNFDQIAAVIGAVATANEHEPVRKPSSDIDELEEWNVPQRINTIIVEGFVPGEKKKKDSTRSGWLFDVVCGLVRHRVPDERIVATVTNPAFRISDSVLDKKDPAGYAERQIARAKDAVAASPLILSPRTPLVTAREFVQRVRPALMHHNHDWLAFDGAAYVEVEAETIRSEMYSFLESARETGDPPTPFSPNKTYVGNAIDALEAEAHRPRDRFAPPCWLFGDGPPAHEIVACRNGLLHLPTGRLQRPTWRFFTRNALQFEYDDGAAPPVRWLAFLEELWPDEPDVVGSLQEIFGYLLVPDTSLQKIFMLVGPPRSGKGTIARVLTGLVGKHNTCAPTLKGIGGEFGLEPLIGKQLALISDLRLGAKTDHAAIAENLLRISGEDMVSANRKYKRTWDGKLAVRFVIMTNEMPSFVDASGALANRFIPLIMRRSFLHHEDPALSTKLLAELPGVLLWAIAGWRRLNDRGHFEQPESSRDAIQRLADLASPVAAFVRDACELATAATVPKHDLYAAYSGWCARNGVTPDDPSEFGRNLLAAAHGHVGTRKPRDQDDRTQRVPSYAGIRLRRRSP